MPANATERPTRVWHVEPDEARHAQVRKAVQFDTGGPRWCLNPSPEAFLAEIAQPREHVAAEAVVLGAGLSSEQVLALWRALRSTALPLCTITLGSHLPAQQVAVLLDEGMADCLPETELHRLRHIIERSLELERARRSQRLADSERAQTGRRMAELTEHLQSSIEQERAAIAREVHDDIGGSLAAVKFDLAWIARHSADQAMLAHASSAAEMVQHALGASQRIMMNLRPAILDQGLVASVQWLASGFERRTGIRTSVRSARDTIQVPKDVAMVAYRTAQEAMTNISKYAQCNAVKIELTDAEGVLTLEITDNGRGLQRSDLDKPKTFGIKGLQERARTVGGWLDVSSHDGRGTTITLSVPLTTALSLSQQSLPA